MCSLRRVECPRDIGGCLAPYCVTSSSTSDISDDAVTIVQCTVSLAFVSKFVIVVLIIILHRGPWTIYAEKLERDNVGISRGVANRASTNTYRPSSLYPRSLRVAVNSSHFNSLAFGLQLGPGLG